MIITCASWEDRFYLGFERLLRQEKPTSVIMYYYKEYASRTNDNRLKVDQLCKENVVSLHNHELSFDDPAYSWKKLFRTITGFESIDKNIIVDITTMPREAIWSVFYLLDGRVKSIKYTYHKPAGYDKEWLSRDPERPRLVFKLGGLAKLGLPSRQIILAGFDIDRIRQLILFYEPELNIIGTQTGDQFEQDLRVSKIKEEFKNEPGTTLFEVDAYSDDHGEKLIEEQISPYIETSNIILSSLGPKPSAVALYRLHKKYPETALAYAPSRDFNINYSHGIGATIEGQL